MRNKIRNIKRLKKRQIENEIDRYETTRWGTLPQDNEPYDELNENYQEYNIPYERTEKDLYDDCKQQNDQYDMPYEGIEKISNEDCEQECAENSEEKQENVAENLQEQVE